LKFLKTTLLLLLLTAVSTGVFSIPVYVQAQEIPREEVVYISDTFEPPAGWNPLLPSPSWGTNLMYGSLFLYSTRDDVWIPWIAESYRWVDKYTLEVKIRPEAKWWDGTPITASDVKYTFDIAKRYSVSWSGYWDYLEEVKGVDDKTVQFITSEEKLNYYQLLGSLQGVAILPKHRYEALEAELGTRILEFRDDDPTAIVGSGPYRLYRWSEDYIYYIRVDDWWGKDIFGLPRPKYVAHKTHKDNIAASLSFEQGLVDATGHFHAAVWEWEWCKTYYSKPPYYLGQGLTLLYINYAKYPLNNLAVRRAIAYAIPYNDFITKAYFNYSVRASPSMVIDNIPVYTKWINYSLIKKYKYDFDLDKAKAILDEANITDRDGDGIREMPDGTKLGTFTIQVPYGWSDWCMMCDMLAVNLRKIGIDAITEFPESATWVDRMFRGEFDIIISWDGGWGFDHPWNTFRFVMDPRLTGPVGEVYPSGNWERYMNWEVIPLIDAAAKETDPEKLKSIYSKLQEIALRDLPAIPLFYGAGWYNYREDYWVGWPNEDDPRWLSPYPWNYPNNLPVFFGLSKASEGKKPMPSWVKDLQIPSSKIFEDLGKAPEHKEEEMPPILPEIESLKEAVEMLTRETSELKGDIESLSTTLTETSSALLEEIHGLSGQLSTMSMAAAVEGIAILVLAIAVIVIARRKPA